MSRGIIYFSRGSDCLTRLVVSLHSLRKVYDGDVSLLIIDDEWKDEVIEISKEFDCNVVLIEDDGKVKDAIEEKKERGLKFNKINYSLLSKVRSNTESPYDTTIFLDCDTVVVSEDIVKLFDYAEVFELVLTRFRDRITPLLEKRIRELTPYYPELIEDAVKYPCGINCGVYAFRKESKLIQEWYEKASVGAECFIPDESYLQASIHNYRHAVVGEKYNRSNYYDDVNDPTTVIQHFHGKKHCSFNGSGKPSFDTDVWMKAYNETIKSHKIIDFDKIMDKTIRKQREQVEMFLKSLDN